MSAADDESLKQLFERARELPAGEQEAFLENACPNDPEIRAEVASLIAAANDAQGFFDSLADAVLSLPHWPTDSDNEAGPGPDPFIGRLVHQYRVEEKLGSGGMGVVFRAHDTGLNRAMALKFLPPHLRSDDAATERFLVEAQAAAALDHPNVCTVHEIGEDEDGRLFIAMAYYEGETLKQKLERGPLPVEEAWDYAQQIAAGLGAAHGHDIVHRDIKPGNVIVTPEGVAKVLDFGLAKLTDITLTGTGTTLGTVAYMSPEQAKGEAVDHCTDLWSLGVVLYEMLTGERPFKGDSTAVVLHAIQHEDPERPSNLRGEIPSELEAIVGRLLAKSPRRRPTSAEMLDLIGGETTAPAAVFTPPPRAARVWATLRSWRALAALAVVIAAVGGLWIARSPLGLAPAPIQRLAVLPLDDLTGDPEQAYYVAGVHHGLITSLGQISGLDAISRQSVLQYVDSEKSIPEIADELDVEAVIEGSVSLTGDTLLVTARLVRARPERQAWSDSWQEHLSTAPDMYNDVARAIAEAIAVPLTAAEITQLTDLSPVDPEAYAYYLRGNEYYGRSWAEEDIRLAIQMYERSVELDPEYALAYAKLSEAHNALWWYWGDRTEERRERARRAADRALALDRELPEARVALAWYSIDFEADHGSALADLEVARRRQPGNADVHYAIHAARRHLGDFEEAISSGERALELNPAQPEWLAQIAWTHVLTREYERAGVLLDRAIALTPDEADHRLNKAWGVHLIGAGDVGRARQLVSEAARVSSPTDILLGRLFGLDLIDLIDAELRSALLRIPLKRWGSGASSVYLVIKALLVEREEGMTAARSHFDSALIALEGEAEAQPDNSNTQYFLGLTLASLGRSAEASQAAQRLVELRPRGSSALWSQIGVYNAAQIYALAGQLDTAIEQLEYLMSVPSFASVASLRANCVWDPLRDHPRFQALLERYE